MERRIARPRRRSSLRLRGFDYASPGAYFSTVCTHRRACILASMEDGASRLTTAGRIVAACWLELPEHYACMGLDAFVILPNHVHGVIVLHGTVGAGLRPAPTPQHDMRRGCREGRPVTLTEVVRAFKGFSARRINLERRTPGAPVWQRGFYEHVIRDEADLHRIRRYIEENPLRWAEDEENR